MRLNMIHAVCKIPELSESSLRRLLSCGAFFAFLLASCLSVFVGRAFGASGALDEHFGAFGRVTTPVGQGIDGATAIAVLANGKILVAGECHNGSNFDICAVRYLTNGTLDTGFAASGRLQRNLTGNNEGVGGLVVTASGDFLLAGGCTTGGSTRFCVSRYKQNGEPDTAFGTFGFVSTSVLGIRDMARSAAIQTDSKILVTGSCLIGATNRFCTLRYLEDGTLDITFGDHGLVITSVLANDEANAMTLQPDGKIIVAGTCHSGTAHRACAVRHRTDGSVDETFATNGKFLGGRTDQFVRAVAVQPDGKIVLAGHCVGSNNNVYPGFCVSRLGPDGSNDTAFAYDGLATTAISGPSSIGTSIVIQNDGKLVVAGQCIDVGTYFFSMCLVRYTSDGQPDSSFGFNGRQLTKFGIGDDMAFALALQPDGKVVLAGECGYPNNADFCLARYEVTSAVPRSCSLDLDGDGLVLAFTDALLHTRIALGMTGDALTNGITFPIDATRKNWGALQAFLSSYSLDIDGDSSSLLHTDALIHARVALGITGDAVVSSIVFPANATRTTWPLIRDYLGTQCGMSLAQ